MPHNDTAHAARPDGTPRDRFTTDDPPNPAALLHRLRSRFNAYGWLILWDQRSAWFALRGSERLARHDPLTLACALEDACGVPSADCGADAFRRSR